MRDFYELKRCVSPDGYIIAELDEILDKLQAAHDEENYEKVDEIIDELR